MPHATYMYMYIHVIAYVPQDVIIYTCIYLHNGGTASAARVSLVQRLHSVHCCCGVCCRYVCDYLREQCPDTTKVRVHHLGDLVKLDESCNEVLELIELSLTAGVCVSVCV